MGGGAFFRPRLSGLRRSGQAPPGHRLVRRDALRHGPDRCRLDGGDLFVSIGTSGAVYPAAGYVQTARYLRIPTLEINLEPSQGSFFFDQSRIGRAGELVPAWVEEMLGVISWR
jgi:hypothetical protein